MGSDNGSQQSATWYMRGSRPSDQPPLTHATQPRGDGLFAAVCDDQPVVPLPGHFDPAEEDACPLCAKLTV
jgi:hypothetical protein